MYARNKLDPSNAEWMENPAGIVFHTTESDQIEMQPAQNRTLQTIATTIEEPNAGMRTSREEFSDTKYHLTPSAREAR